MKRSTPDITFDEWKNAVSEGGLPSTPPPGYYTAKEITERLGHKFTNCRGYTAERLRHLIAAGFLRYVKGTCRRKFYKLVVPPKKSSSK